MTQDEFRKLLKKVWAQKISVEDVLKQVRLEPYEELDCARVDHHRMVRCGFPEVIFCQGKRPEDITEIAKAILKRSSVLLATRADGEAFRAIQRAHPKAEY